MHNSVKKRMISWSGIQEFVPTAQYLEDSTIVEVSFAEWS